MMRPSVLTIVRNRAAHLDQLVEGLRRSATPPAELVVVDMSDVPVTVAESSSCSEPCWMVSSSVPRKPEAENS